jgi:Plant mobile domain
MLVKRWRFETNTYHLLVGKIIVMLQDVSCLWGLSIGGSSVVGRSDRGIIKLIKDVFGMDINNSMIKKNTKNKRGK